MDMTVLKSAPGAPQDCTDLRKPDVNGTNRQVDCDVTDGTVNQQRNGVAPGGGDDDDSAAPTPYNWDTAVEPVQTVTFKELFRRNWHPTIVYCGVFWSFGMCVAFLGPTLLDLGCQTASDMKEISWVFFCQLVTTLIGSIAAGALVQRTNANVIVLVSCILIPIFMFFIPFCESMVSLAFVLCLMGLNMGAIDCLANVQMISLFGDAVPPFLQAMHFCYGFGAFVSPLIAEPFLLNQDCSSFIDGKNSSDGQRFINHHTVKHHGNRTWFIDPLYEAQNETEVRYSFFIMAALQVPVPFLVATLLYREKVLGFRLSWGDDVASQVNGSGPKPAYGTIASKNKDATRVTSQQEQYKSFNRYALIGSPRAQIIVITACTAVLLFIFDGLQSEYGGYIYSYALQSISRMNKTEGAYLNAVYWGSFALGRLLAIAIATVVSSACMLFANMIGCLLSMIFMLCLRHNHTALYIGTCTFGLFLSSSTPTTMALAEQYIDISSTITTIVVVSAALGDMISPVVVGNMFARIGPWTFFQFGLAFCIAAFFVYFVMIIAGSQTPKHLGKGPTSFMWCPVCCVRPPAEVDEPTRHVKYYTRMSESDSNIELSTEVNGHAKLTD